LAKAGNYNAKVTIQGGISDNLEHKITEMAVNEAYEGEVFGPLMHVRTIGTVGPAFRYEKKGVVYVDGDWRNIQSDRKAILCQKLFTFPESVLATAITYSGKGAKWLPVDPATVKAEEKTEDAPVDAESAGGNGKDGDGGDGNGGDGGSAEPTKGKKTTKAEAKKDKPEKAADSSTSKGKTIVKNPVKGTKDGEVDPLQPRVVRVEAPAQEGLKHFISIQNSGCMGVG
jgi:hypothetical protein